MRKPLDCDQAFARLVRPANRGPKCADDKQDAYPTIKSIRPQEFRRGELLPLGG